MKPLRWIVAVAGLIAAGVAIVWLPTDDPLGPATAGPSELTDREGRWRDADWNVLQSTVRWATAEGVDTVPFGEAVTRIGRRFVGTPYEPGTLEVDGPERVVINFRALDCVTLVENVLALTRFVREGGAALLADRPAAEDRYAALLREIRYRGGTLDGYPSRLHYFSEWIADNARRGLLVDLGGELDGVVDAEPIDFMSTHPDAYRQLSAPEHLERIRAVEARLRETERMYVPQEAIPDVADRIRNGDVIAATSTVPGLDIAHTGLALWIDDALHLLHAPLVGEAVQISEAPLAERILDIESQDGIMVARPQGR